MNANLNPNPNPMELTALHLRDPLMNHRLSSAIIIIPCGCRLNEETVRDITFIAKEKLFEAPPHTTCPQCKNTMTGKMIDEWTRKLVRLFFESVIKQGYILSLPPETAPKWIGPLPPYPQGERGKFERQDYFHTIAFRTTTASPLNRFALPSFDVNEKYLDITFTDNCNFANYLLSQDFNLTETEMQYHQFHTTDSAEIKKLIEIIKENNDLEEEILQILDQLNRKTVTVNPAVSSPVMRQAIGYTLEDN